MDVNSIKTKGNKLKLYFDTLIYIFHTLLNWHRRGRHLVRTNNALNFYLGATSVVKASNISSTWIMRHFSSLDLVMFI